MAAAVVALQSFRHKTTPTRKTDAWGTLVPFLSGEFQKWYSLLDARCQHSNRQECLRHPPHADGRVISHRNIASPSVREYSRKPCGNPTGPTPRPRETGGVPVITLPIGVAVLVAVGTTSIIASSLILYVMIGHVNRKLPEDKQIPYFFSFSYPYVSKATTIKREYKRFYPNGHLHTVRIVLNVLGFILIVACAAQLSHYWR